MRKTALFLAGVFFTLSAAAQKTQLHGNGDIVKQERQVSAYQKIKVDGPFTVNLVSGQPGEISIKGDGNIIGHITTEVKDGTLIIAADGQEISDDNKITIKVAFRQLDEVSLTGSGSIDIKRPITNDMFKVTVDGTGSIDVCVDAQQTYAWVIGSGEINIKGQSENLECRVIGAGDVDACELEAGTVAAFVSGSGKVKANSTKASKGRISGSGNIAFAGNPETTDLKHSGSGGFSLY